MRLTIAASLLALTSAAFAQDTTVMVGSVATASGGIFQFIPPSINATNGSVITFTWSGAPGNHSVTQSAFNDPCNPLSGGFDSGFIFVPTGASSGFPTWNLTITDDSKPIWFYCKQLIPSPHCQVGMVGAINAPISGNTFSSFQSAAMASSGVPGQGEGGLVGSGASASAPPGPLTGSFSGAAVPTATAPPSGSNSAGSGSSSSTTSAPATTSTTPTSGASSVAANSFVMLVAAAFGFTLA